MTRNSRGTYGFTLMELMIVVAIAGILSAIAIPTFTMLMNRSKTAEVGVELNSMFKSAAAYYQMERTAQGGGGSTTSSFCIVPSAGPSPSSPTKEKQSFSPVGSGAVGFAALGFTIADAVYYAYEVNSSSTTSGICNHGPNEDDLYTFAAHGDLDGDSNQSTFELATGSDKSNVLYHAFGFYVDNEME